MRILIIEDEIKLANATQRALKLQKYAVDVAYDGEAGLDLATGEKFDLIILDMMLPKMNGVDVLKSLRKERISTPVLVLTARSQVQDKVTGLDNGADDYMVKPFSFEELFARIRALTRRPQTSGESVLKIKDLTLDPITFKIKKNDKDISLSTKEFALLQYLMKNKNTVLKKEQILEHVWNYESDVLPSTVEVHIKHIRDKIGPGFIYTIRGFGYEIRDEE